MARQDRLPPDAPGRARRLHQELADAALVERATGVLMEQTGATADAARARLVQDAARAGSSLPWHCAQVLAQASRARPAPTPPTVPAPVPLTRCLVTTDPERAREELSAAYRTPIAMIAAEPGAQFRIEHTDAGLFQAGEHRLPGRLYLTSQPAPQVVVARLLGGGLERQTPAGEERLGVDDVFLSGQPGTVHTATTDGAHIRTTTLPLPLLHKVAGQLPEQSEPFSFLGLRPATAALADHWRATRGYLQETLGHPALDATAPLLVANAAQLLAATALAVFPNTATAALDTVADRADATPATVRRAVLFIDEHAHEDITLADIAAATQVTPRALQYAFRRHFDTTPLAYLRDVRLHRAHRDLLDADPATATVTQIAARWGFLHPGRFATRYQALYHCPPSTTLHA